MHVQSFPSPPPPPTTPSLSPLAPLPVSTILPTPIQFDYSHGSLHSDEYNLDSLPVSGGENNLDDISTADESSTAHYSKGYEISIMINFGRI